MLRILAAAALVLGSTVANAAPVTTPQMTCGQAQAIIQRQGAALLYTAPEIYDRFVRDRSQCTSTQITKAAFLPTRDVKACMVGYTCVDPEFDPFDLGN